MKTHSNIFERICSMATKEAMEIFAGAPFYICIAKLSAKSVSLPKHMIVASATNTLSQVTHAWSDKPDTVYEPRLDSTTLANGE